MKLKGLLGRPLKPAEVGVAVGIIGLTCCILLFGWAQYKRFQNNKEKKAWFEAQKKQSHDTCIELIFALRMQAQEAVDELRQRKEAITPEPHRPEDDFRVQGLHQSLNFRQLCSLNQQSLTTAISATKSCFEPLSLSGTFPENIQRSFDAYETSLNQILELLAACVYGKATKDQVEKFNLEQLDQNFHKMVEDINTAYPTRKRGQVEQRFETMKNAGGSSQMVE